MNVLWLQSAGCGGCTMSLLTAESPGVFDVLTDAGLEFLWHPALSEASGGEVRQMLNAVESGEIALDVLCVEGSILTGPRGTGRYQMLSGTGRSMLDWVESLAPLAAHVMAVGTCAAYGGVTSAGVNAVGALGLQYDGATKGGILGEGYVSRSGLRVINVAGCPTHPGWVTESLLMVTAGEMRDEALDDLGRPLFYAENLVHHACPKNEFYEYKASAEQPGQMGCMMEHMGCIGTQAVGDCNIRGWNGGSSCTRAGYACINCTAPEFEEPGHAFSRTPKFAGIPVGLPSDMPKAWFIALSSLSKAATPKRLSENATADRTRVPPNLRIPKS